jgi:hypothetical protein
MLDVDPQGFDLMDRKLLEAVIHRFDGGPVGLDNVAAAIGEEAGTIEDVIEPYLIQQGLPAAHAARARGHAGSVPPWGWRRRTRRGWGSCLRGEGERSLRHSPSHHHHRRPA